MHIIIDNGYQIQYQKSKGPLVIKILKQAQKVDICSGASCRAWDSEKIARELRQDWNIAAKQRKFKVCRVSCLNRCGGGVSVKIPSSGTVIKIKKPEKTMRIVVRMLVLPRRAEPARS